MRLIGWLTETGYSRVAMKVKDSSNKMHACKNAFFFFQIGQCMVVGT